MSGFSADVKEEILSSRLKNRCCRKAMLDGMLFGGLRPEHVVAAAKLSEEFRDLPGGIESPGKCAQCGWAFIRGLFLSCGTVSDPSSAYHFELAAGDAERAEYVCGLLSDYGYTPGTVDRKNGQYGVYFKDSEQVFDILNHIGAPKSAFRIIDAKIYRELRNNANRVSNCELANISKTVRASEGQLRAIDAIIGSGRVNELPEELKATLDLRAAFPDLSLSELAEKHSPPLTRSGLNHRLKRIVEFSKKCK
jgi:DNA-binding protein WhiA